MVKRKSYFTIGLGLILDENYKALHHRTLLKIILNPIIKIFGFVLVSHIETVQTITSYEDNTKSVKKRKFIFSKYEIKKWNRKEKINFTLFIDSNHISENAKYIIPNNTIINSNEYHDQFMYKLFY